MKFSGAHLPDVKQICPACDRKDAGKAGNFCFTCTNCGHWFSELKPLVLDDTHSIREHDFKAQESLHAARNITFTRILDLLDKTLGRKLGSLLDVGCSDGWFMQYLISKGIKAKGVEADPIPGEHARQMGLDVVIGFYPQILTREETFDAISFLDVLGHFEQMAMSIEHSVGHLKEGGTIIIKTPVNSGFIFKASHFAFRLGFKSPWERVWQIGFGAPQLHIYSSSSMASLAQRFDLKILAEEELPAFVRKSLYERIRDNGRHSHTFSALAWCAIMAYLAMAKILHSDSKVFVLGRKQDYQHGV